MARCAWFGLIVLSLTGNALAQRVAPALVADHIVVVNSSNGHSMIDAGTARSMEPDGVPRPALFFGAGLPASGSDVGLWVTDGTAGGTVPVGEPGLTRVVAVPGGIGAYLLVRSVEYGQELYYSDGTPAGTRRITDLAPGSADGLLGIHGVLDGKPLVLRASGATAVVDPASGLALDLLQAPAVEFAMGTSQAFAFTVAAGDFSLWRIGTTPAQTRELHPPPGEGPWYAPHYLAGFGDAACFKAGLVEDGDMTMWTPFCTDGTQAGTRRMTTASGGSIRLLDTTHFQPWGTDRLLMVVLEEDSLEKHLWATDGEQAALQRIETAPAFDTCSAGTVDGHAYVLTTGVDPMPGLWHVDPSGDASRIGEVPWHIACHFGAGRHFAGRAGVAWFLDGLTIARSDGRVDGTYELTMPSVDGLRLDDHLQPWVVGDRLLFVAKASKLGKSLWAYDLDAIFVDGFGD